MPSAKQIFMQTGFAGLALAGSPFRRVEMAQDAAMPQNGLRGPRLGARDQDDPDPDDDSGSVYTSQAQATFARLHKLLAANLSPEDLDTATELVQQLFIDTDDTNANTSDDPAMAADRRLPTPGYSKHFPNAHRLGRSALNGVVSGSGGNSMAADDGKVSSDYAARFPHAGRLVRTF